MRMNASRRYSGYSLQSIAVLSANLCHSILQTRHIRLGSVAASVETLFHSGTRKNTVDSGKRLPSCIGSARRDCIMIRSSVKALQDAVRMELDGGAATLEIIPTTSYLRNGLGCCVVRIVSGSGRDHRIETFGVDACDLFREAVRLKSMIHQHFQAFHPSNN